MREAIDTIYKRLEQLPSAQPELANNSPILDKDFGELISRKAAIDAIIDLTHTGSVEELRAYVDKHGLATMWSDGVLESVDAVACLPSVQPEQKILKDGTLCITVDDYLKIKQMLVQDGDKWGGLFYPDEQPKRKTGKWISLDDFRGKYNENGYKCSKRGEHSDYEENFCPNCGAHMKG